MHPEILADAILDCPLDGVVITVDTCLVAGQLQRLGKRLQVWADLAGVLLAGGVIVDSNVDGAVCWAACLLV